VDDLPASFNEAASWLDDRDDESEEEFGSDTDRQEDVNIYVNLYTIYVNLCNLYIYDFISNRIHLRIITKQYSNYLDNDIKITAICKDSCMGCLEYTVG